MISNTTIVEKMVNGCYGLAHDSKGRVLLLHGVLPGEKVRFAVTDKTQKVLFARPLSIDVENGGRIKPPCKYYGKCGGCSLQHCDYQLQLDIKNSIINDFFSNLTDKILPTLPSPQQFGYRQRIRLQVHDRKVGFHRFRSNEIVPIHECMLASPQINQVFKQASQTSFFQHFTTVAEMVEFILNPDGQKVTLIFHLSRKPRATDKQAAEQLLKEVSLLERVFFKGADFSLQGISGHADKTQQDRLLSQSFTLSDDTETIRLAWEVGAFVQANLQHNISLIKYVLEICHPLDQRQILDLYCGMGNFSIPLANLARTVLGVESQGAAVRCAKSNSINANLRNTTFLKGDVNKICSEFVERQQRFDITLVDPPRQGLPDITWALAKITGQKLVYISCDPATLARDTRKLLSTGFSLSSVQPFDMFPQTHHIEAVAIFEKN